jgi:plastocyanin
MPGQFNFMDHAMARMAKGLIGTLEVKGETTAELMHAGPASAVADIHQILGTGPTPMAEIIAKDDSDAASPTLAASGPSGSDNENSHMKMNMKHAATAASTAAVAGSNVRDGGGRLQRPGAAQLDGCLTFAGPLGIPNLKLFRSQKSYELEPRSGLLRDSPLAFAQNVNALVHITGHLDRNPGYDGKHWFIVEAIDQLAPSCHTERSLAQLRSSEKRRLARANAAPAGAVTVGMGDMTFLQPDIIVNVGQEVVWRNTSSTIHNVVADPAKATVVADVHLPHGARTFDSGYLQPGQTFVHAFTVPGVYRYVCTLHEASGMKGVVIVKAPGATNMARATGPNQE